MRLRSLLGAPGAFRKAYREYVSTSQADYRRPLILEGLRYFAARLLRPRLFSCDLELSRQGRMAAPERRRVTAQRRSEIEGIKLPLLEWIVPQLAVLRA